MTQLFQFRIEERNGEREYTNTEYVEAENQEDAKKYAEEFLLTFYEEDNEEIEDGRVESADLQYSAKVVWVGQDTLRRSFSGVDGKVRHYKLVRHDVPTVLPYLGSFGK